MDCKERGCLSFGFREVKKYAGCVRHEKEKKNGLVICGHANIFTHEHVKVFSSHLLIFRTNPSRSSLVCLKLGFHQILFLAINVNLAYVSLSTIWHVCFAYFSKGQRTVGPPSTESHLFCRSLSVNPQTRGRILNNTIQLLVQINPSRLKKDDLRIYVFFLRIHSHPSSKLPCAEQIFDQFW